MSLARNTICVEVGDLRVKYVLSATASDINHILHPIMLSKCYRWTDSNFVWN